MTDVVWKLVVDDEGSIKKIEEVDKAGEKTDKTLDKTKHSSDGLKESLKNLGGAFGGLKNMIGMAVGALGAFGVGTSIESVLSTTKELTDETERFHAITGMGASSSLDYVAALKARGVGTEAIVKGYKTLGKAVQGAERQDYMFATSQEKAHAQGKLYTGLLGTQAEAFNKLGISLTQLRGESPEKQFQSITEKLEGMKGGLEKSNIAALLFGRGATSLLPLLEKGALSLNHFRQMAERFFPTLKGEGVKTLEQLREKQAESKLAWEGLEFTLGMEVAPAISSVLGWFSKTILVMEKGHGVWGTVGRDAKAMAGDLKEASTWLAHNKLATDALAGSLSFLAGAWAFEKVLEFVKAITALTIVQGVATGVKGMAGAIGALPGVEAAATATTDALLGASSLLLGTLDAYLAYKLVKGYVSPEAADMSQKQQKQAMKRMSTLPGAARAEATAAQQMLHREELVELRHGATPQHREQATLERLASAIEQLHAHGQSGNQIVGEMHLDGAKVGEVLALNPKAMRFLTEGVERQGLKRSVGHG